MNALAQIHVAKRDLGLDDDTYRAMLVRVTGKDSAKAMSAAEHQDVIAECRRLGFNGGSKPVGKRLDGPYARKLQALWISAWNLGLVDDRRDQAMLAFIKRQTKIEHTRFLRDPAEARKVVEALKAWIARDAGVDWTKTHGRDWLETEQAKIAWAQFAKLIPGATLMGNERMFVDEVRRLLGRQPLELKAVTALQWRAVMNDLGKRVRKVR